MQLTPLLTMTDADAEPARTPANAIRAGLAHGRYPVVPEALAAAVAALDDLDARQPQEAAPVVGLAAFNRESTEALLAGGTLGDDFATRAHQAQVAQDRQEAATRPLDIIRNKVEQALPRVVTDALPELLGGLRVELDDVMAGLAEADRRLGDLDIGDPGAVAAATNDQRAALTELGNLRRRYRLVRTSQHDAYRASDTRAPGVTGLSVGHGWPQVAASGVTECSDVATLGLPDPDVSPAQRFRALAHRADVWLPGVAGLHVAWDALTVGPDPAAEPTRSAA